MATSKKYYAVEVVQNGLWVTSRFFMAKAAAQKWEKMLQQRNYQTRIERTWPNKLGEIKENPAKRKKAVSVPSQITGKKPTKRLTTRRKKNTVKGYFPNPAKKKMVKDEMQYWLQTQAPAGNWVDNLGVNNLEDAKQHGQFLADKYGQQIRIVTKHIQVIEE